MRLASIFLTVVAALALAVPAQAADSGFELGHEPVPTEARAPSSDWLASPPDPARLNLWVPTLEWATCLSLTIPLFLIDPSFVNVGPLSSDTFAEAWTQPPDWDDGDGIVANYVLHPFMGAEAYLTVRNRGYGPVESFLFATAVTFMWEYVFEAWVQHPSGGGPRHHLTDRFTAASRGSGRRHPLSVPPQQIEAPRESPRP